MDNVKEFIGVLNIPLKNIDKFRRSRDFRYLVRFRYPKLLLLIVSIAAAYIIFTNPTISLIIKSFENLSYIGIFIFGMLFSFGFSAPFAIGFFLSVEPNNIFLAAIVGGIGALVSDIMIFRMIKVSFQDEFDILKNEKVVRKIRTLIKKNFSIKLTNYLLFFIAGFLIASPLPDEAGVSILAGLTSVNLKILGILSFIFNTIGIYIILIIGM